MAGHDATKPLTLHASSVAFGAHGILIRGSSGAGKSALALELIGLGAELIADDRTIVHRRGGILFASAPSAIRGKIECRGLGILHAPTATEAEVKLLVDLSRQEEQRLPQKRTEDILGLPIPLCNKVTGRHFASALKLHAIFGRAD